MIDDDDPFGANEPVHMGSHVHVPKGFNYYNIKPHIARMHGMWYCIWPLWLSGTISEHEKALYGSYMRRLNGVGLYGQRIASTEVPEHLSVQ